MLVLTRKLGEKIQIGNATITVTRTGKCNVMIGIDAPHDVRIQRVGASSRSAHRPDVSVPSRDSVADDQLSNAS